MGLRLHIGIPNTVMLSGNFPWIVDVFPMKLCVHDPWPQTEAPTLHTEPLHQSFGPKIPSDPSPSPAACSPTGMVVWVDPSHTSVHISPHHALSNSRAASAAPSTSTVKLHVSHLLNAASFFCTHNSGIEHQSGDKCRHHSWS